MEHKLQNNTDNPVTFIVALCAIFILTIAVNLFTPAEQVRVASDNPAVALDTPVVPSAPAAAEKVEPEK